MKKKAYTLPLADCVAFASEDIVTLSIGITEKAIEFKFSEFFNSSASPADDMMESGFYNN